MSHSLRQMIALLQSTNAQAQLITAMIGEIEVCQPTEYPMMVREEDGRVHPLEEPVAAKIPAEDQDWIFSLGPEEVKRAEAIAKALDFPEGNTAITEIVVRGLLSLEAEIARSTAVLDGKNAAPAEGWRAALLEDAEAESL